MHETGVTDNLKKGFSYLTVYALVQKFITGERHKLLQAYRVTVKKTFVPIQGMVDYESITVKSTLNA